MHTIHFNGSCSFRGCPFSIAQSYYVLQLKSSNFMPLLMATDTQAILKEAVWLYTIIRYVRKDNRYNEKKRRTQDSFNNECTYCRLLIGMSETRQSFAILSMRKRIPTIRINCLFFCCYFHRCSHFSVFCYVLCLYFSSCIACMR